jgi:F0F1-type ATP synthase assembly protein I
MNRPDDPLEKYRIPVLNVGVALASQVGFAVVGIVLIAVLLGVWLDKTLDTKPIFTIILLLGSGPISMYLVLRLANAAIAKIPPYPVNPGRGNIDRDEGGQEE